MAPKRVEPQQMPIEAWTDTQMQDAARRLAMYQKNLDDEREKKAKAAAKHNNAISMARESVKGLGDEILEQAALREESNRG